MCFNLCVFSCVLKVSEYLQRPFHTGYTKVVSPPYVSLRVLMGNTQVLEIPYIGVLKNMLSKVFGVIYAALSMHKKIMFLHTTLHIS